MIVCNHLHITVMMECHYASTHIGRMWLAATGSLLSVNVKLNLNMGLSNSLSAIGFIGY